MDGSRWKIRPLHHLRDHRDPVDAMSWSPDGKTLVTGADKGLYLWDTQVGRVGPAALSLLITDGSAKDNSNGSIASW